MHFEALDIWIIVTVVGLALVVLAAFRPRDKEVSRDSGKQFVGKFVGMGILWILLGLGYSLWRGGNPFESGIFNLGLIFSVAGSIQLVMGRYNKRGDRGDK